MKNLAYILSFTICLLSCRKEAANSDLLPDSNQKKYSLLFDISDFSQQVQGIQTGNSISDAPLNDFAKYLVYIAYNSDGIEVSRLKQDSVGNTVRIHNPFPDSYLPEEPIGQQTFGCIKDSLAAGQYTVVMVASKQPFSISNRNEQTLDYTFESLSNASFYYNRGLDSWSRADDTFFKKFNVTVANQDIQQSAVLNRIVGKAEINITDSKPGATYKFLFVNEYEAFKFNTEMPFGNTDDIDDEQYVAEIEGKANLSYSKFILNTSGPVNVIINAYEGGVLSATKTVENIRFYKNKRTILTGNIYSAKAASTGFTVTVNDKFEDETERVSF